MINKKGLIQSLRQEVKRVASKIPKEELFGNPEIIAINKKIDFLKSEIKNSEKCPECNGTGESQHECDCDFCDIANEGCAECGGDGVISKKN